MYIAERLLGSKGVISFPFLYYYFHLCLVFFFPSADIFVNDPLFHENGQISVRNELHSSCVESFILMVKTVLFLSSFLFFLALETLTVQVE